jgi:hypothetical protein
MAVTFAVVREFLGSGTVFEEDLRARPMAGPIQYQSDVFISYMSACVNGVYAQSIADAIPCATTSVFLMCTC